MGRTDGEGRVVKWTEREKIDGQTQGGHRWQSRKNQEDRGSQLEGGGAGVWLDRRGRQEWSDREEAQIDIQDGEIGMARKRVEAGVVRCRRDKALRWRDGMTRQRGEIWRLSVGERGTGISG